MAWEEVEPKTVAELFTVLFDFGTELYLCRGQTRTDEEWKHLTTTLSRAVLDRQVATGKTYGDDALHRVTGMLELHLIDQFRQQAHMHLSATERFLLESIVGHLNLMQHYGAPTRLLDWTLSPWVAAYFAAVDHPEHDGAIWVVENNALVTRSLKEFRSQFDRMTYATTVAEWAEAIAVPFDSVTLARSPLHNSRMVAQQSLHTMAGTFTEPHDVLIDNIVENKKRKKIIVSANLKGGLVQRLDRMNVNRYSLFGGADGVGRRLSDYAKSGGSPIVRQKVGHLFLRSQN